MQRSCPQNASTAEISPCNRFFDQDISIYFQYIPFFSKNQTIFVFSSKNFDASPPAADSSPPEDEEALLSYKYYLKPIEKYKKDGIVYVLAEEVPR